MRQSLVVPSEVPGGHAEAARTWLHDEAEVIDTANVTADQVASRIADAVAD
jgi:hypothetical protein